MPGYPSTFISASCHMVAMDHDMGELWIIISAHAENDHRRLKSLPAVQHAHLCIGLCVYAWSVDDMWAGMYESNQPSNYHNRFSLS